MNDLNKKNKTGFLKIMLFFLSVAVIFLLAFCAANKIPVFTESRGEEIAGDIAEKYTEIEEKANSLIPAFAERLLEKLKRFLQK